MREPLDGNGIVEILGLGIIAIVGRMNLMQQNLIHIHEEVHVHGVPQNLVETGEPRTTIMVKYDTC